ncbi:uncharacterized protein E0L32_005947 [Thyridium curvatum]|uniref:AAA+ ATPase domain-containing protein n=1 Tax=Thyridium curvatum TaxID=1093900 RepID=A0A507B4X2_9PEZI|nr:uncharacterized protein E0L32_005947 [Thyridium curvatum]TPX13744.1 hypothetical protein E0L32_005947 [Thyridium curvatum]
MQHGQARKEASAAIIVHRIAEADSQVSHLYLDRPRWSLRGNATMVVAGQHPIFDLPAFLTEHSEVAFLVYRDYQSSQPYSPGAPDRYVEHTSEEIVPATSDLKQALTKLNDFISEPFAPKHYANHTFQANLPMSSPYPSIFRIRDRKDTFLSTLSHEEARQFQVVFDYVLAELSEEYQTVNSLLSRKRMTYPYLKYLFWPGELLTAGRGSSMRGYLSTSTLSLSSRETAQNVEYWKLDSITWDFDGSFSRKQHQFTMVFSTDKSLELDVEDLPVIPSRLHGGADLLRLWCRGQKFWKCRSARLVSYQARSDLISQHPDSERFMVDVSKFNETRMPPHNHVSPNLGETSTSNYVINHMTSDTPPDQLFLQMLPSTIKGYSLERKKWLDLEVDGITDVAWNKKAWEYLVLDCKSKQTLQALASGWLKLAKSAVLGGNQSADYISGKGTGLVLLLQGPAGTGKTLTAESLAESLEMPLLPVSCGDFGTDPKRMKGHLEDILALGKAWGCVILLDDMDLFLEERWPNDHQHNAMTSVLARALEHHDGIIILTCNRVDTLSDAFKSRIQLTVQYPALVPSQRAQIWRNLISRICHLRDANMDFDDLLEHVEELSQYEMNGREIRNVFTTARQLAEARMMQNLDHNHIEDIIHREGTL